MLYSPPGHWLAAPRLLYHEGRYHLFHLQGPVGAAAPVPLRHALSTDLLNWEASPLTLAPGPPGAWDDLAISGCGLLLRDRRCYCLYTGLSSADKGSVQRLGLAFTDDFRSWQRHPDNPVLEADGRWYETGADAPWRDPYLYADPIGEGVSALICARTRGGTGAWGCLALARSADLVHWECRPPAYAPATARDYLLPELFPWQGKLVLAFGTTEGGYRTAYVSAPSLDELEAAGPPTSLLGGPGALEGAVATAETLSGRGAVHLVCPSSDTSTEPRGTLALPKTLTTAGPSLCLSLRRDLYTSPINCLDCSQLVVDQLECWHTDNNELHGQVKAGRTFLPLASSGNRTVSAAVRIAGEGEAGYVIGFDEVLVVLNSDEQVVLRMPAQDYERRWPVGARAGELSVVLVGGYVEVYFNRCLLGTAAVTATADLPLALFCAGTLSIIFSGVALKQFELRQRYVQEAPAGAR